MECKLRKTEVKLLDGETYSFRALPLSRRTTPIIRALLDDRAPDFEKLEAFVGAVALSLSYDQDEATVDALMDNGVVPFPNGENEAIHAEIMSALIAGQG